MTSPINDNARVESYNNFLHKKDKVANSIESFFVTISTQQSAAQGNRAETFQNTRKYEIKNSASLVDLAKRFIQSRGEFSIQDDEGKISQCIQNYAIENEDIRIELAKLAIQNNPGKTSEFIQNYKIKDEIRSKMRKHEYNLPSLPLRGMGREFLNTLRSMKLQIRKL